MKLLRALTGKTLGRGGRPLRIAYGRIFHEANAYSPIPTTLEDFERIHHLEGERLAEVCRLDGAELRSFMPHAELTGFCQAARLAGGVTTIPLASSLAVPGGPLTLACYEQLRDGLLAKLCAAMPVDGVYLALHGSMQVHRLVEAPETDLLRRVRGIVGPTAAVAASYDLHANLSAGLIEPADVVVAYRSNPHWDLAPTGFRAGNRLIRVLRGELRPVHAWRKLPIAIGGGMTIDFVPPMRKVFRFMKRLEDDRPGHQREPLHGAPVHDGRAHRLGGPRLDERRRRARRAPRRPARRPRVGGAKGAAAAHARGGRGARRGEGGPVAQARAGHARRRRRHRRRRRAGRQHAHRAGACPR